MSESGAPPGQRTECPVESRDVLPDRADGGSGWLLARRDERLQGREQSHPLRRREDAVTGAVRRARLRSDAVRGRGPDVRRRLTAGASGGGATAEDRGTALGEHTLDRGPRL